MIRPTVTAGVVAVAVLFSGSGARAQSPVVTVATAEGSVDLEHWAIVASAVMRMGNGSLDDVPSIAGFQGMQVNLPNWEFTRVLVAREDLFETDRAERRTVPVVARRVNTRKVVAQVSDLERPERLAQRLKNIGASADHPAYAFIGVRLRAQDPTGAEVGSVRTVPLSSEADVRYYVFKIVPPAS